MSKDLTPEELLSSIAPKPPEAGWMDTPVDIKKGIYS